MLLLLLLLSRFSRPSARGASPTVPTHAARREPPLLRAVSGISRWILYHCATREAHKYTGRVTNIQKSLLQAPLLLPVQS